MTVFGLDISPVNRFNLLSINRVLLIDAIVVFALIIGLSGTPPHIWWNINRIPNDQARIANAASRASSF